MITFTLVEAVLEQVVVDPYGIHGLNHWARVYENGLCLAMRNGARKDVVALFALFHDSCRRNEGKDLDHGPRGASLAHEFHRKGLFQLDHDDLNLLLEACRFHTALDNHDDITVGTCFDADRLDLGRVGISPEALLLSTDTAKDEEILSWANHNSRSGQVLENILTSFIKQPR